MILLDYNKSSAKLRNVNSNLRRVLSPTELLTLKDMNIIEFKFDSNLHWLHICFLM